jgi:hypothetical protein
VQDVEGIRSHAEALLAVCLLEGLGAREALTFFIEGRSRWVGAAMGQCDAPGAEVRA